MPRSLKDILEHASETAEMFESRDADPAGWRDATELRGIAAAVQARAAAERDLSDVVGAARGAGHSWASIGLMLGTSGEAARQKYGAQAAAPMAGRAARS